MNQPMKIDRNLVIAKIRRLFPNQDEEAVLAKLDRYGREPYHREPDRVHLDILKLYEEEPERGLDHWVQEALGDYRDVIAWAESPRAIARWLPLGSSEQVAISRQDRDEYEAWLKKL